MRQGPDRIGSSVKAEQLTCVDWRAVRLLRGVSDGDIGVSGTAPPGHCPSPTTSAGGRAAPSPVRPVLMGAGSLNPSGPTAATFWFDPLPALRRQRCISLMTFVY